jgi:hypothetical protein
LSLRARIMAVLPQLLSHSIQRFSVFLSRSLGISCPELGAVAFPYGVCTVSLINAENDSDVALMPDISDATVPITVACGGTRFVSSMDAEKKVVLSKVLNYTVCISTQVGSLSEASKFCSRLQHFLNNPSLMDLDEKLAAADAAADSSTTQSGGASRRKSAW